ncbi:NUDIX hydrolase [Vibrio chagasii]|nr:NUDIX hydrolase [Vibrio chagasii]
MIVTLDFACFRINDDFEPEVLLRKRTNSKEPAYGESGLIGGWVWENKWTDDGESDENTDDSISRILRQKVGVTPKFIKNVGYAGSRSRDSRGWSITLIHYCLLSMSDSNSIADSEDFKWVSVRDVLDETIILPFDHNELVERAWREFVNMSSYSTVGLQLLPEAFIISQVVQLFAKLGIKTSKQTVMSRMVNEGVIVETDKKVEQKGAGRRSTAYTLASSNVIFYQNTIG